MSASMPERTGRSVAVYTVMMAAKVQVVATSVEGSPNDTMASVMPSSSGSKALAEAHTKNRRSRAGTQHRNVPALTSFSLTPGSERYALTCQWSRPLHREQGGAFCEGWNDESVGNTCDTQAVGYIPLSSTSVVGGDEKHTNVSRPWSVDFPRKREPMPYGTAGVQLRWRFKQVLPTRSMLQAKPQTSQLPSRT